MNLRLAAGHASTLHAEDSVQTSGGATATPPELRGWSHRTQLRGDWRCCTTNYCNTDFDETQNRRVDSVVLSRYPLGSPPAASSPQTPAQNGIPITTVGISSSPSFVPHSGPRLPSNDGLSSISLLRPLFHAYTIGGLISFLTFVFVFAKRCSNLRIPPGPDRATPSRKPTQLSSKWMAQCLLFLTEAVRWVLTIMFVSYKKARVFTRSIRAISPMLTSSGAMSSFPVRDRGED